MNNDETQDNWNNFDPATGTLSENSIKITYCRTGRFVETALQAAAWAEFKDRMDKKLAAMGHKSIDPGLLVLGPLSPNDNDFSPLEYRQVHVRLKPLASTKKKAQWKADPRQRQWGRK